jgi:hypothetical protein
MDQTTADPLDTPITLATIAEPTSVAGMLSAQRDALKGLKITDAERARRIGEMEADLATVLRNQKRAALYTPTTIDGDRGDLSRYMSGDVLHVGDTKRTVHTPVGPIEVVSHGLLTDPVNRGAEHLELRQSYAALALCHAMGERVGEVPRQRAWHRFVRAFEAMPGRIGQWARATFASSESFQRAINGAAGTGAELLATPTLASVKRPPDLARLVPGLIATQTAGASVFKIPTVTGRALPRMRTQRIGNDPARNLSASFTTAETSYSLVSRYNQALIQDDFPVEASLVLADPIGFINQWLNEGDALGIEAAFLHGDTAATHQDTLSTWDMNGLLDSAGDLSGSDSILRAWIGFRAHAVDQSATLSAGGTYSIADHWAAMAKFGANAGADPRAVRVLVGLRWLYESGLNIAELITVDKAGANATAQTGEIGNMAGSPVVISECMGKQFDTTSGLYTGSNQGNAVVHIHPSSWVHFVDPNSQMGYDVERPENNARYIGMKNRSLLVHMRPSSTVSAVLTYNA